MRKRLYYLISFAIPFSTLYFLNPFTSGPSRVINVYFGSFFGLLTIIANWLIHEGLIAPKIKNKGNLITLIIVFFTLIALSMPLEAGKASGESSNSNRVCKCFGESFKAESTPKLADVDRRKYCYGIPYSCEKKD